MTYLLMLLGVLLSSQHKVTESLPKARPLSPFPDTATMVFVGDVMMHRDQISNALGEDGNYSFPTYFKELLNPLKEADLAVANMEFTLAGKPYTGYPCFSAPDSYAGYVADCGVDVFLTANNHILDKGKSGIERTLGIYSAMESERGVRYTGCAMDKETDLDVNPLVIRVKGTKVAFVNFTYGTNQDLETEWPKVHRTDTASISSAIMRARKKGAEFIIALPHWGTEYSLTHSKSQHSLAVWLAEKGCDAVIGTHPHVVQDMETVEVGAKGGKPARKVPVIYSLGNIVSNMTAPNTRIGLVATLWIVTEEDGSRRLLDPLTTATWCCVPGTMTSGHTVVPVRKFLDKKDLWKSAGDYDNMVKTYDRVKAVTGIDEYEKDNNT